MNTVEAIMSRHSVRAYTDEPITDAELKTILDAAVSGPCCVNAQDWDFIVVRDKETLNKMADANGRPADVLRKADVGILICGNLDRAFPPAKDYWIIDGAIAGENMTLAAWELGIGSVWLGTYPQMDRVENQAKLFGLPESIIPHSVIAFGHLDPEEKLRPKKPIPDCIHYEKW